MSTVRERPPAARHAAPRARRSPFMPTATVYLALAVLLVVGSVLVGLRGGVLLDHGGVLNILTRATALGLVAVGQTVVVVTGSLDLSVAYLVGLCSLVAAETMAGAPSMIAPGVLLALAVAAGVGLVNGLVVTGLRVNPFIATLGVALILRGYLEHNYTGPAGGVPRAFQHLGYGRIGPVPLAAALVLLVAAGVWWYMRHTRAGHHMYAVGGDVEVARLSGVRTSRTIVTAHVLCAVMAGLAGVFLAARLGSGAPHVGTDAGYDLESIAAVVLGGAALAGGRGGVVGTLGGVLILSTLDTVFDDLAVDPFFKDVVRGVVLIAAVALYARRKRSGRSS